jgi:phytoene synthase
MPKLGSFGDVDTPGEIVERIVSDSGTSFALGMKVLPKERRDAMFALYAFCRVVDDIVDEPGDLTDQRTELQAWRAEVDRLYQGCPNHPIARALAGPIAEYRLPKDEFLAIIDGMEMDLGDAVRTPDIDQLVLYCRRVAGAVGMISVRIFGVEPRIGPALAIAQGEALQITNILRDLAEDAAIGRLYLPADLLHKHGIESDDPATVLAHPNLGFVAGELVSRARARYAEAGQLIAQADRRAVKASRLMLEMYRRILDRLEARGWQDLGRDVGLSKVEKIWIFLRYGM